MDKKIFEEIRALKRQILPNDRVILFGSQARGDERPDSDWDLLVLVDRPRRHLLAYYDDYGYPFAEVGWKHGVYVSAKVFTLDEWEEQKPSIFCMNVENDGIEIV